MKDLAKWEVAYHKALIGVGSMLNSADYEKFVVFLRSLPVESIEQIERLKYELSKSDFIAYIKKSIALFEERKPSLLIQKEIYEKFKSVGKDIIRNAFDYGRFSNAEVELLKEWIEGLSSQQIWENVNYIQAVGKANFAENVRLIIVSVKDVISCAE